MTCKHPWDIAVKPAEDYYICHNCRGIYKAEKPGCPKTLIKCQGAPQVPTARKVG